MILKRFRNNNNIFLAIYPLNKTRITPCGNLRGRVRTMTVLLHLHKIGVKLCNKTTHAHTLLRTYVVLRIVRFSYEHSSNTTKLFPPPTIGRPAQAKRTFCDNNQVAILPTPTLPPFN